MKIEHLSSNEAAQPVVSPVAVDAGSGQPLARQVGRQEVGVLLGLHEDQGLLLGIALPGPTSAPDPSQLPSFCNTEICTKATRLYIVSG